MAEKLKEKLVQHGPYLLRNVHPSTLLWAELRSRLVIDADDEERCKVCVYTSTEIIIFSHLIAINNLMLMDK